MARRFAVALAVIVAVVAAVIVAVDATGGDSDSHHRVGASTATSVTSAPSTAPGVTTVPIAQTVPPIPPETGGPFESFRLGYEGFGPVKLGMTLEQASAAAGTPIELLGSSACGEYFAQHTAHVVGHYENDTLFGVKDGVIVNIVTSNPTFATISGIRVGSSYDDVLATYPNARAVEGADAGGSGSPLIRITDAQGRQVIFRFRSKVDGVGGIGVSAGRTDEDYVYGMC